MVRFNIKRSRRSWKDINRLFPAYSRRSGRRDDGTASVSGWNRSQTRLSPWGDADAGLSCGVRV